MLTWWEALEKHALASGVHVIVDDSYREVARFPAGNGRSPTCTSSSSRRAGRRS